MNLENALKDPQDLERILSEAYMNIIFDSTQELYNPLLEIPEGLEERPELFITYMMSQPDFFTFTCKYILNINIIPLQAVVLRELWMRKFPMLIGTRGMSKSFCLALYIILRLLLLRDRKIVICGAAFRQSKIVFNYVEQIINNSSILRSIFGSDCFKHSNEMHTLSYGNSFCNALPLGDGSSIRGQRAHDIITDEFASVPIDIFEVVIAGFAAVSASPIDNVKLMAKQKLAELLGVEIITHEDNYGKLDNQIIISGTASYDFNHFSKYHKNWLKIIKSRGNKEKLRELFKDEDIQIDSRDYSVIRVPIDLVPDGFMDKAQIARSKATMTESNYIMDYGAGFVTDSDGFFKNSLLLQCTVGPDFEVMFPSGIVLSGNDIFFEPMLYGDRTKNYVYGVDPAAKKDNFSIVILEDCGEYRKIVHVWVTNDKAHKEKVSLGLLDEHNFYAYCSRKIRTLMQTFPTDRIAIDAQGGGLAVMENLRDKDKLNPGELPILQIIVPGKPKESDGEAGLHILEPIEFTSAAWTSEANHGLKKDFEDKVLLFPYIDTISYAIVDSEEEEMIVDDESMDTCLYNLEELKQELITIIVTETATGREHFDTPETKTATGKKGRLKKDRYSALLMANDVARRRVSFTPLSSTLGGFAKSFVNSPKDKEPLYRGPGWLVDAFNNLYSEDGV